MSTLLTRLLFSRSQEKPYKITTLPFYGGAQGQVLQIVETPDGAIESQVVQKPTTTLPPDPIDKVSQYEYPELPTKYESEYGYNIRNIQQSSSNIIKLQKVAKERGVLNEDETAQYEKDMEVINESAKALGDLQLESASDDFFSDEGLTAWFDKKREQQLKKKPAATTTTTTTTRTTTKKKDNKGWVHRGTEQKNKKEEQKQKEKDKQKENEKEKEKEKEEEEEEDPEEDDAGDSVIINQPSDDASVAEAKPVGLAVAGVGGVASSKPVATAVAGPAGLAVARPVATAIAGVDADQTLVPVFAEGYVKPTKKREPSSSKKQLSSSDLLNRIISKYHHV